MEYKFSQKMRILKLAQILFVETDDDHCLTRMQINKKLTDAGFEAPDGDTFRDDMRQLSSFGIDIITEKVGHINYYHIGQRTFELAELKIIVDTIQSSRFFTENKSKELIKKIEKLSSKYEAEKLERQVFVTSRIKSDNNSIFYNVDIINTALNEGKKIGFRYFEIIAKKKQQSNGNISLELKKEYRHNNKMYKVSPWTLISNNQNYYLVGCSEEGEIRHYRVDRMDKLELFETPSDTNMLEAFKVAEYAQKHFEMFSGDEFVVNIEFEEKLAYIICDRFGNDIDLRVTKDGFIEAKVRVCVNNQFLSWIISLGNGVRITGPTEVVKQMQQMLKERLCLYQA